MITAEELQNVRDLLQHGRGTNGLDALCHLALCGAYTQGLLDALDDADAENAALKRDAERWRELERRTRYWNHTCWAIKADCVGGLAESIDAAIAERKRKDAT